MEINKMCNQCGELHTVELSDKQLEQIEAGELIQNVAPGITPNVRELFITGICGWCFMKFLGGDEEDE